MIRRQLLQALFRAAEWASAISSTNRPPESREILILSAHTPDIAGYAEIAAENKRRYAQRHGYAFRSITTGFDPTRPPAWSKIRFIQRALHEYRWVFWSDADALIMNDAVPLQRFIVPDADVHLTRALSPFPHINTGHMFFRRCPFSRVFLNAVWKLSVFTHDSTWEQRAVNHLVDNYSFARLRISPNREFNAYGEVQGDPSPYRLGDFIVHFPGKPDKLELMQRYAALGAKSL